tara:strand:+ start:626 stop:1774 length:1149 start_codon:yes stop_codon:yes gene_type:complete
MRNLSKYGIHAIVCDSTRLGMSQFSRFSKGFEYYTSHYLDEEKFINDLVSICVKHKIDFILPSHNETEIIARNIHKFGKYVKAIVPNPDHCAIFNNKKDAYNLAASIGIPVPRRVKYNSPETIKNKLLEMKIDRTVIKLLTGNSSKGVFYSDNPKSTQETVFKLIHKYNLTPERYPQIEEFVSGDGYGSSVFYWDNRLIANVTHRRLREKIRTGGTSTLRETTKHQKIEEASFKLFDHIGWNGMAMCEFKVNDKTGEFWFIEVNPRMWGSIPVAIASGVEFPYIAWLSAKFGSDTALNFVKTCEPKIPWRGRWLLGDIFLFASALLRFQLIEAVRILFLCKSNSVDDFYFDDPLPFFGQVLLYLRNSITKRSLNPSQKGMVK